MLCCVGSRNQLEQYPVKPSKSKRTINMLELVNWQHLLGVNLHIQTPTSHYTAMVTLSDSTLASFATQRIARKLVLSWSWSFYEIVNYQLLMFVSNKEKDRTQGSCCHQTFSVKFKKFQLLTESVEMKEQQRNTKYWEYLDKHHWSYRKLLSRVMNCLVFID